MNVWEKGEDWLSKDYYYSEFLKYRLRLKYIVMSNRHNINIESFFYEIPSIWKINFVHVGFKEHVPLTMAPSVKRFLEMKSSSWMPPMETLAWNKIPRWKSWCKGFCPQWSESQTVRPLPSKSSVVTCFQDVLRRQEKQSPSTCASMCAPSSVCSPDLFSTCVWYKPCFYQWDLYHFQLMIQFFVFPDANS